MIKKERMASQAPSSRTGYQEEKEGENRLEERLPESGTDVMVFRYKPAGKLAKSRKMLPEDA